MSVMVPSTRLKFFEEFVYLPRVTVRDGKAIEQALAGPDLLQPGVQLSGAVVEATLAQHDSALRWLAVLSRSTDVLDAVA